MKTIEELLSEVAKTVGAAPKKSPDIKPEPKSEPQPIRVPEYINAAQAAKSVPTPNTVGTVQGANAAAENVHNIRKELVPQKLIGKMTLSLSLAKEIAYCVERGAQLMGVSVVIAIANDNGNLILLEAMDDSYTASLDAARQKAYTAAALKMPTHTALAESRGGALDGYTNGNGILMLGGGYPLTFNGTVVGSVGVSGGTKEQDMLLAEIGTEYFKQRLNYFA